MEKNILICNNDPLLIELNTLNLEEKGYKVFKLEAGENLRRKIEEVDPRVIVLDFEMGAVTGDDICRYLKNNIKTMDINLIIYSKDANGRQRAINAGADYFIHNTNDSKKITEVFEEIFYY